MQQNKNGIPIQFAGARAKQLEAERQAAAKEAKNIQKYNLSTKRFATVVDGVDIEAVIPNFSPIQGLLRAAGWREVEEDVDERSS